MDGTVQSLTMKRLANICSMEILLLLIMLMLTRSSLSSSPAHPLLLLPPSLFAR